MGELFRKGEQYSVPCQSVKTRLWEVNDRYISRKKHDILEHSTLDA